MMNPQNSTKQNHKAITFWMIVLSGIGGILYGYDVGVFSGAMPFIQETIFAHVPASQMAAKIGIIGGAVFGGGLAGTLITGYLADKFGRRAMIIISCIVFLLGIFFIVTAHSFEALLIARLLLGIGVGIVAVAVPLYLTEVAPTKIRGKGVTVFQLFLTLGILLAYLVDLYFTPSGNWRAMFTVITIPALILLISMLVLPESPRWLVSKNKEHKALNVLKRIRSAEQVEQEFNMLQSSLNVLGPSKNQDGTWRELFSKNLALPLFLAVFVAIFNQFTAINGFLQYAPSVFQAAGLQSNNSAMMGTIGLGLVNFIVTAIALNLIDKLGRRQLVLTGTAGIVVSYVFLALLSHFHLSTHTYGILSLIGLLAFVASFAIGPGVVVWLAISELFPTEVRGKGVAIGLFASSLSAWAITSIFLTINLKLGLSGTYWLFAGCTVIYFIVVWKLLPETKQRSLEAVQAELQHHVQR